MNPKSKKRSTLHGYWRQLPCCRAFNQINIGVLFMHRGKIEFVNRQMCAYVQKEARALYGKSWGALFRGNTDLIAELKGAERALNESDCCYYLTEKSIFPHHYLHRVFKIMCFFVHPQNKQAGICYIFQDITDLISQKLLAQYERASAHVFDMLRQSDDHLAESEIFYHLIKEIGVQYHFKKALYFTEKNQKLACSFSWGADELFAGDENPLYGAVAEKAYATHKIACSKNIFKNSPAYQALACIAFPIIIRRKAEGAACFYGTRNTCFETTALAHLKHLFHAVCLYIAERRGRKNHQSAVGSLQKKLEQQILSLKKNKATLQHQIDESGKIVADLIIARNQAVAAGQAQMKFLANISHELRTPLNAVLGFADVMAAETFGKLNPPIYKEYVSFIQKSARHLLGLINDILDVSRAESGKMILNESAVDLKKTLRETLDIIGQYPEAGERTITLHFRGKICLKADERALKQIFLNILSNAVKFTNSGGHIDIYVKKTNNGVRLVFQDDGIGIAADKMNLLFKPFSQIANILTRSHTGSGLGLVLIKKMVILHQGTIFMDSTEGVGTKLTVCFPKNRIINQ